MLSLSCPSCGAAVNFQSKASVFAVCSYCKSTLVRHDMDLEKLGTMADLQDELTALQIGSIGYFGPEKFELIGRLKVSYSEGVWNEWYALFSGERTGWLAEAQGFYAMCFPLENIVVPTRDRITPGAYVHLGELGQFDVDDLRLVKVAGSEGELPIQAIKGRESLSVDLSAPGSQMATIEYAEKETRVFAGYYQEFDEFKFVNLRKLDGW